MFEQTERQFFAGTDVNPVITALCGGLQTQGFRGQQTAANTWQAQSLATSYGTSLRVTMWVVPSPSGFAVEARYSAEFENNALIVFAVLWFVFFPAAIVLAILGYQDVTNRLFTLRGSFWMPVASRIVAPNFGPPLGPGPMPPAA
ncbi:MAG TPA: hypothetical protein VFQ61_14190 [Polyangiaceae bacterium]|nr:hypothetical protein [Polyangiaceae bacterium]